MELLVVIAILAILVTLSLVGLTSVRRGASDTRCLSNLRQLLTGFSVLRADDTGLLPYASYAPQETDGPCMSWQKLHARWSEAAGVAPARAIEGVRTSRGWKVYDIQAPWRCPGDVPGSGYLADDPTFSYAGAVLSSYEYWPASHISPFAVRGWSEAPARRFVTQAYEAQPGAPILGEANIFHRDGKTWYINNGYIDGSAGRPRLTPEQDLAFRRDLQSRYPWGK